MFWVVWSTQFGGLMVYLPIDSGTADNGKSIKLFKKGKILSRAVNKKRGCLDNGAKMLHNPSTLDIFT